MMPAMPQALHPRQTEQSSQYRWFKGGARLVGRAGATWVLVWLAWAIAALMLATTAPLLCVVLMGISMMTFDLNVLAFDQVASSRPRFSQVLPRFMAFLRHNARTYLVSFLARMALIALVIVFTAGVFVVLRQYLDLPTPDASESPGMFGLAWNLWAYAWFLPALFQRGGFLSIRSWLMRRHGLSEQHASDLQELALIRNHKQMLSFQQWIMWPSLACVFFLPIALPFLELFWVASMRCMYQDIFHGNMGIEKQQQAATQTARQPGVLPAA